MAKAVCKIEHGFLIGQDIVREAAQQNSIETFDQVCPVVVGISAILWAISTIHSRLDIPISRCWKIIAINPIQNSSHKTQNATWISRKKPNERLIAQKVLQPARTVRKIQTHPWIWMTTAHNRNNIFQISIRLRRNRSKTQSATSTAITSMDMTVFFSCFNRIHDYGKLV